MRRQTKAIVAISAFLLLTAVVGVNVAVGAAPSATIDAPSSVSYTSAHLSGTVNPNGGPASITVYAEYKEVGGGGWSFQNVQTIEGAEAEGTGPIPVETDITGLKPGTEYEVRFDAYSEGVETYSAEPNPTLTTLPVGPPATTVDPVTTFTSTTAQLSGSINPGNADPAFDVSWRLQYSTDESKWEEGPSGNVPAGTSPVAIEGSVSRLEPNTTYYVRLRVSNAGGTSYSAAPNRSFTTVAVAPTVVSLPAATYPGGTEASLGGFVNAKNTATTYWIEYGPTASYGTSLPASEDASAGSAGKPLSVTRPVSGLSPNTTYHFRLIAKNSVGTTTGPDMTFTTGPAAVPPQTGCANEAIRIEQHSTFLPDCRAWEKVSPADKGGVDVAGLSYESKARAAVNGGSLIFSSLGQFAGAKSGGFPSYYYAQRGAEGWTVKSTQTEWESTSSFLEWKVSLIGRTPNILWTSDDLQTSFSETTAALVPGARERVPLTYKFHGADSQFELVTPPGPNYTEAWAARNSGLVGAPVFMAATADGRYVLFITAWDYETGAMTTTERLYRVDTATGDIEVVSTLPGGGLAPSPTPGSFFNSTQHAISEDGSRVYFGTNSDSFGPLYLHEGEETVEITPNGKFYAATPDGSRMVYRENGQAYLYDAATEASQLISPPGTAREDARNILAVSEDLDYVYMMGDVGPLVPDYQDLPEPSYALYLWHDGNVKYLATLGDSVEPAGGFVTGDVRTYSPLVNNWRNNHYADWTPDGKDLVFAAMGQVTGYDPKGHREVYRYDAESDQLSCLSCPRGPATGDAQLLYPNVSESGTEIGTNSRPIGQRDMISRDGKRVFFSTPDPLLPEDTNGRADLYVWEDGQLHLISDGSRNADSRFLAATGSGDEVFFATTARLTRSDEDDLADVYVAKVDGGFPEAPEPAAPCSGEGCQPAASAAPEQARVASNLVAGSGNQPVQRKQCAKPRKKSHRKAAHKKKARHRNAQARAQAKKRAGCNRRAGK